MKLAIVKHIDVGLTETFIRAHVEGLPADITLIHGHQPRVDGSRSPQSQWSQRLARGVGRWLGVDSVEQKQRTKTYIQLLRREGVEAVMAEYGLGGVAVLPACRRLGLPLIVHFHGYDASRYDILEQYRAEYADLFEYATAIVAVSRAMKSALVELGAPAQKVYCNPCGADTARFVGGCPSKAPPVFIAVGRLVEKKAPHLLLLAFSEVYKQRQDARLRVIGDGPLLDVCRDLAVGLGVADAVTFLGHQPHDVVEAEMQGARAFVQHSIVSASGDSEGTPVAVMEAGASGLPVVSTRHAGIPDVVVEGETGLLVDERDASGMAEAMLHLVENPEQAQVLGEAGRERVLARFSLDHSLAQLWRIIQDAVAGVELQTSNLTGVWPAEA